MRGAQLVSRGALAGGRGRLAQLALVNGAVGMVIARRRRPIVFAFAIVDGQITEIDVIGDPERLQALELGVLE